MALSEASAPPTSVQEPQEVFTAGAARAWEPPPGTIVLLAAYSRFGQGHISRTLKIAEALHVHTDLQPVVVSGHPQFVRSVASPQFPTLILPPFLYTGATPPTRSPGLSASASPLPEVPVERLASYRGHLLRLLWERCRPAAVLIDHFPFSGSKSVEACGELVEATRRAGSVPVLSGFRGLLSERFLSEDRSRQTIIDALSSVAKTFVYIDPAQQGEFFERHEFLRPAERRFDFVGYVGPGEIPRDPPEQGLVLATFGGGIDSFHRLDAVCRAFLLARERRSDLRLELITGRQLPEALFDGLEATYRAASIRFRRYVDLLPRRFSAAELVVCGAGYNTLIEIGAVVPKRVLAIPNSWSETSEQFQTARRFAELGSIDYVLPQDELEPRPLASRLVALLDAPSRTPVRLDLRGAERTARRIERLVAHGLG